MIVTKESVYVKYVTALGFNGVEPRKLKYVPMDEARAFKFDSFNSEVTRKTLGKAKAYKLDLFVFVLARDKAVRVDTKKNLVILGNSRRSVRAFLAGFV